MSTNPLMDDPKIARLRELYQAAKSNNDAAAMQKIETGLASILPQRKEVAAFKEQQPLGEYAGGIYHGAKSKVQDWFEGARMIGADIAGEPEWRKTVEKEREARYASPEYKMAKEELPLFWAGEILPQLAIPGGGGKYLLQRIAGAALGSGAEDYVSTGGDVGSAAGAAALGALGNEAGVGAQRFLFGRRSEVPLQQSPGQGATHKQQVERAENMGFELTPAQRTDRPVLKMREAGMISDPWFAEPLLDISARNQDQVNRTVRDQLGLPGFDKIDDYTLDEAHTKFGSEFERLVGSESPLPIGPDFLTSLKGVEDAYNAGLLQGPGVTGIADNLRKIVADGSLTVHNYQKMSSNLARLARGTKDDPEYSDALYQIRDALDDQFDKSFGDKAELQALRGQYKTLRDIERSKALDQGNFSPQKYYNYVRGQKGRVDPGTPLNDLAINRSYFRDQLGNSGTATRQSMQAMVDAGILPRITRALGGGITDMYLKTGGGLSLASRLPPKAQYNLSKMTDILVPRLGRELGAEQGEQEIMELLGDMGL